MLTFIENELKQLKLKLNPGKTHVRARHEAQLVHGLAVGHGKISVPKAYRTALEREVRRVVRYGGSKKDHESLLGSISYISRLHPKQAKKFRSMLRRSRLPNDVATRDSD